MPKGRYQANFTKASLLVTESRIIADLLLDNVDEDHWHQAIVVDNVLQKRTQNTAKTQAGLIRNRLGTMGPELWTIVARAGPKRPLTRSGASNSSVDKTATVITPCLRRLMLLGQLPGFISISTSMAGKATRASL